MKGAPVIRFSHKNLADITEINRLANVRFDLDSLREDVIQVLHKAFRSDSTIFWLTNSDGRLTKPVYVNIQRQYMPRYHSYFFRQNPFDLVNLDPLPKTCLTMEQIVSLTDFRKTEYYNDFIKPQKIRRQMAVYVKARGRLLGVIGLHRSREEDFHKKHMFMGEIIASHMSASFEKARLFEQIEEKGSFFRMICDNNGVGIAILDMKTRPVYMNRKAGHICARIKKDSLTHDNGRNENFLLPSPLNEDCAYLKHHAGRSQIFNPPIRQRFISVSETERYLINCQIIDEKHSASNESLFMITMEDIPIRPIVDEHRLRENLGLTTREIEIISYIFKGYKNSEIAETLFISEGTVKNHLKNIFRKSGARNRTGLMNKVMTS